MPANCPRCDEVLSNPKQCKCGWRSRLREEKARATTKMHPNGDYQRCEWVAQSTGEICNYPGTMSSNTHEGGPYFCGHHFDCDDPVFGEQIVEASRDYRHQTLKEALAEHTARAKESLSQKGLDRQPDESLRAWRTRTMRYLREQMAGIGKQKVA